MGISYEPAAIPMASDITHAQPPSAPPAQQISGDVLMEKYAREDEHGIDDIHRRVMEITGDPLPYGVAANRKVLDELIGHAVTQGIISRPVSADELFHPGTRSLQDVLPR